MSETTQFRVLDFDCPACASTVERALSGVGDWASWASSTRLPIAAGAYQIVQHALE